MIKTSITSTTLLFLFSFAPLGCSSSDSNSSTAGTGGSGGSTSAGGSSAGPGGSSNAGGAGGSSTGGSSAGGSSTGGTSTGGSNTGGTNTGGSSAGGTHAGGAGAGGTGQAGSGQGGTTSAGGTAGGAGPGTGGSAGQSAGGSAGTGTGGSGGSSMAKTPFLCPETDSIHPKLPNTVVITDSLAADAHWTADKVYVVSIPDGFGGGLDLAGHSLTIDAGTVVCFDPGEYIAVGKFEPGEIHIDGTADNPVVFTAMPSSQDPTQPEAFHTGLQLDSFKASTVKHLAIWYAGRGGGGGGWAVHMADTATGTGLMKLEDVQIDLSDVRAVYVGNSNGIDPTSSIHVGAFASPGSGADPDAIAEIDFGATTSLQTSLTIDVAGVPPAAQFIRLRSINGVVDSPSDLYDLGAPYRYHDILTVGGMTNATLTLHEGVTLQLDETLVIGDSGHDVVGDLVAVGTDAKPVIITSSTATPAAQDWGGIYFTHELFSAKSKIDHAQILYGGFATPTEISVSYCFNPASGSIMIEGPADKADFAGPPITNTIIAHSAVDGIVAGNNVGGSHFTTDYSTMGITFMDIAGTQIHTADCP